MKKITIDYDLLCSIADNLSNMINYADDGMLNREDDEYKEFFKDIDNAYEKLEELNKILYEKE